MTSLSRKITFPPGWPGEPLDRRIALGRAALALERILPRLWPAFGFGGFYLALALTGLFQIIPWPVQALLLAATITAMGLSLENGFRDFQWPRRIDGARRLERDNSLAHRPLSERGDVMASRGSDPLVAVNREVKVSPCGVTASVCVALLSTESSGLIERPGGGAARLHPVQATITSCR